MKSLSLTQPWATLVAVGAKRYETRGWKTPYRGDLAIHAAAGMPAKAREFSFTQPCRRTLDEDGCYPLPRGAIVAVVRLLDCVPTERIKPPDMPAQIEIVGSYSTIGAHANPAEHEHLFGDYTPGRWAWITTDLRRLREPVPHRGHQGIRDLPPDVEERVRAQLVQQ